MRVELTRSGGFAGVEVKAAADTAELPDEEAGSLRELVADADLERLAQRSPLRGRGADRFQYDLVVSDGERRDEITVSEDVAPAGLRALIDWLIKRREERPPAAER